MKLDKREGKNNCCEGERKQRRKKILDQVKKEKLEAVPVGTWWYWVSKEWYWLIYDATGSVEGGTCWHLVVLGHLGGLDTPQK